MSKTISYTERNLELSKREVDSFLERIKNIKIGNWNLVGLHKNDFSVRFRVVEDTDEQDVFVSVTANTGTVRVNNIDLCRSEELYNNLQTRLRKAKNQQKYRDKQKEDRRKQKTIKIIRGLL